MRLSSPVRAHSGFTLIELMIVVVIIGILAAIAIPNYNEYIVKARITDAVAKLSDMRVRMEQYFQDNRNYGGACAAGTLAPIPAATAYFTYTCSPGAPAGPITAGSTTFTITATGTGNMTGFTYTINETNTRATVATPWGATSTSCWVRNKNGSC